MTLPLLSPDALSHLIVLYYRGRLRCSEPCLTKHSIKAIDKWVLKHPKYFRAKLFHKHQRVLPRVKAAAYLCTLESVF